MDINQFLTLFFIAFVFVVSPGPGTFAVFAKSINQGFVSAFYLSTGMVLGDLIYLGLVIFSLDLFAEAITPLMKYVRILGGFYLIYLGFNTWRAHLAKTPSSTPEKSNTKELLTGLLISLTNPKVMIFYIAILPAFIDLSLVEFVYAVKIMMTVGLGLLFGISVINISISSIKTKFIRPSMHKIISQISGGIMMLVGVLLSLS